MKRGFLQEQVLLILWIYSKPVPLRDIIDIMQLVYINQYASYDSLRITLIKTLNNLAQKGYIATYRPYRRRYYITSRGTSYITNTQLFKELLAYIKKGEEEAEDEDS